MLPEPCPHGSRLLRFLRSFAIHHPLLNDYDEYSVERINSFEDVIRVRCVESELDEICELIQGFTLGNGNGKLRLQFLDRRNGLVITWISICGCLAFFGGTREG